MEARKEKDAGPLQNWHDHVFWDRADAQSVLKADQRGFLSFNDVRQGREYVKWSRGEEPVLYLNAYDNGNGMYQMEIDWGRWGTGNGKSYTIKREKGSLYQNKQMVKRSSVN